MTGNPYSRHARAILAVLDTTVIGQRGTPERVRWDAIYALWRYWNKLAIDHDPFRYERLHPEPTTLLMGRRRFMPL